MKKSEILSVILKNPTDINNLFKKLESDSFIDWFNKYHSNTLSFVSYKDIQDDGDWNKIFSNISSIKENGELSIYEYLSIFTLLLITTKSTLIPIIENVGDKSNLGISGAFNKSQKKESYNTLDGNKTCYELFSDVDYLEAHGNKPYGTILGVTGDVRWKGTQFPIGFSNNIEKETSKNSADNAFISEADFYKFRSRGFINTLGRKEYKLLLDIIINYSGSNTIIKKYKDKWNSVDYDKTLSQSTNKEWDELFQNDIELSLLFLKLKLKDILSIPSNSSDMNISNKVRGIGKTIGDVKLSEDLLVKVKQLIESLDIQISSIKSDEDKPVDDNKEIVNENVQEDQPSNTDNSDSESTDEKPKGDGLNNSFESTHKVDDIKFDLPTKNIDQANETTNTIGYKPFVWYNGIQIEDKYISSLVLSSTGLIPKVSLIFTDVYGVMTQTAFPLDDTKIKIFINPRSTGLKEIMMEFKITSFKAIGEDTLAIEGLCNLNGLYLKKFESYSKKTSYDALKDICKKIGLGFNSNIDNTNDLMTWINPGLSTHEFMIDIIKSSYKSDDAFLWCYIDFYYNFNYIDVETALNQSITEQGNIQNLGLGSIKKFVDKKDSVTPLILTNDRAHASTNLYFSSYNITNKSTKISLKEGYLNQVRFYDILNIEYLNYDVDSITSEGDKTIILKGAPGDNDFFSQHTTTTYNGKLDKDNMHNNFNYATVQNNHNISEIQKIGLSITLPMPNFNLYRFQKVKVMLVDESATATTTQVNGRLSGEWLIVDIKFIVNEEFIQIISLIKRELEITPEEFKLEAPQQQQTQGESSANVEENTNNINENVPTPVSEPTIKHNNIGKPFKYDIEFSNAAEIDDFFKQFDSGGYVGWFNKNHSRKGAFKNSPNIKRESWIGVWNSIQTIFNKPVCNMAEFISLTTIIITETGATFEPVSEGVNKITSKVPGIAYAFNAGSKRSYNVYDGNKTAYELFRDPDYKSAHGVKPYNTLKDTTDIRWNTKTFPVGFSNNIPKEASTNSADNAFISEADFYKFRGRGFVQVTGRGAYVGILKYIMEYKGKNTKIISYKNKWSKYGTNYNQIANISTNADWDDLFKNTGGEIAGRSVYIHTLSWSKTNNYLHINVKSSEQKIADGIRNVGKKVNSASAYMEHYMAAVNQQISQLQQESK